MRNIIPNWPAPANIRACSTTRDGGVSSGPYASLNLGEHVGDDSALVSYNRQILTRELGIGSEPHWLNQVHGTEVKRITAPYAGPVTADASITRLTGQACIIMTADCLPILLCDTLGTTVAAVHGGWRGLQANIIDETVNKMGVKPSDLMAWLGPAISSLHYEVGPEVYQAFGNKFDSAFKPSSKPNHFMANLYEIAKIQLRLLGIEAIYGGQFCTYDDTRFYSFRRDQGQTGRMATVIWMR